MRRTFWIVGVLAIAALGSVALFEFAREGEDSGLLTAQVAKISRLLGYRHKNINVVKRAWAGHTFETAIRATNQYRTDGNKEIKFTESGWHAPSWSMPRSRLIDINLNEKVKVTMTGVFEGEMKGKNEHCTGHCITTERYNFSEFSIYMMDENGNAQGMRNLGTRDNVIRGNTRSQYRFTSLSVENTGNEIVVTDSSGFTLSYTPDFKYVMSHGQKELRRGGNYGKLNPNQKWFLGINCHVNGEGYCKLDIKEILVSKL